jgi:hypothetical protein
MAERVRETLPEITDLRAAWVRARPGVRRDFLREVLAPLCRFDGPDGKEFRPLTLWKAKADGAISWRWVSWATPRPLYRLQGLAERPSAPVLVTEGEKACDAAVRLLSAFAAGDEPQRLKSR